MASGTRTVVPPLGQATFDFISNRNGTCTAFSNDLNIDWRIVLTPPGGNPLQIHAGPIVVVVTFQTFAGFRVQIIPLAIGTGFPPPPLSLCQVQTDTVLQVPTD